MGIQGGASVAPQWRCGELRSRRVVAECRSRALALSAVSGSCTHLILFVRYIAYLLVHTINQFEWLIKKPFQIHREKTLMPRLLQGPDKKKLFTWKFCRVFLDSCFKTKTAVIVEYIYIYVLIKKNQESSAVHVYKSVLH